MTQSDDLADRDCDEVYIRPGWRSLRPGEVDTRTPSGEQWILRTDGTVIYQTATGERRPAQIVTAAEFRDPDSTWERVSATVAPEDTTA